MKGTARGQRVVRGSPEPGCMAAAGAGGGRRGLGSRQLVLAGKAVNGPPRPGRGTIPEGSGDFQ